MIYHNYSPTQLEAFADDLNRRYDATRLTTPKQVDVYDIVDLLGARLAFEYLSPDRTYLGATLFHPGTLWIWPGNPFVAGMMPTQKYFHGGTIIIDRDLNESNSEQDRYTENYTVIHECFHFDKHQNPSATQVICRNPFRDMKRIRATETLPSITLNAKPTMQPPYF